MFVLGEGQRRPRKMRSKLEQFLKYYYSILTVAQFACMLVFLSFSMIAVPKTITSDMWILSDFRMAETVQLALINCSATFFRTYWGFNDISLSFSATKLTPYLIARCAEDVRFIIVLACLALVFGVINRLMFDLNRYNIIIRQLTIHKEIFVLIEIGFHVALLVRAVQADGRADFLRSFFENCGSSKGLDSDAYTILVRTLPFILPATYIYVSSGIVLGTYALTFIVYFWRATQSKPTFEYLTMASPSPARRKQQQQSNGQKQPADPLSPHPPFSDNTGSGERGMLLQRQPLRSSPVESGGQSGRSGGGGITAPTSPHDPMNAGQLHPETNGLRPRSRQ